MIVIPLALALLSGTAHAANSPRLAPWCYNRHPTDVERRFVVEVQTGRYAYTVFQGGTMDGDMCRSPIGREPWTQTWESNSLVRIANIGTTDVINPWLSNGRNLFRTIPEIVASAVEPGMTQAEKAMALWRQQTQHRCHVYTGDDECADPVKMYNIYGFTFCSQDSRCLAGLWRTAGLQVRRAFPIGHDITEVFFHGRWHLVDGDEQQYFLLRDNRTIACESDIVRDHDLVKRTHCNGILAPHDRMAAEAKASQFTHEGPYGTTRDCIRSHTMAMILRPRESITWRWGHLEPVKYHGANTFNAWGRARVQDLICNGLWEYSPNLTGTAWRRGVVSAQNVVLGPKGLTAVKGTTATIIWKMTAPYVIVGGRIAASGQGAEFSLSWDRKTWEPAGANLEGFFPPAGPARYCYFLRCQLRDDDYLSALTISNDLQMTPLAMPGMRVGPNDFVYTDETPGFRRVRITHEWVERSASQPPYAPASPVYPPDGGVADGTQFAFEWTPAADPDGHAITDYHFQLSDRPDLKWPLSPTFDRLISKTPDAGQARFAIPYVGLLNPGQRYYWRVRAKDQLGVWGPWSRAWSFTPDGPAPPINVRMETDPAKGTATLRWDPNPLGRPPVRYRVYGSDEKGFTVSDSPYVVNLGNQQTALTNPFPSNFFKETTKMVMRVAGPMVLARNGNRAYYRVVAVDDKGRRSGPSDWAACPRPLIYSTPTLQAPAGTLWRYTVKTIRSLGDLRCRKVNGNPYTMTFWDIEQPLFSLVSGPSWLSINESTGELMGTPPSNEEQEIIVAAQIPGLGQTTQRFVLNDRSGVAAAGLDTPSVGWVVRLVAQTLGNVQTVGTFGVADRATASTLCVARPPDSDGILDLYFHGPQGPMASDIRPLPTSTVTFDFVVRCKVPEVPVTLTYPDLSAVPPGVRLTLTDRQAGRSVPMRTTSGYTYRSATRDACRHFQVTADLGPTGEPVILSATSQQVARNAAEIRYTLSASAEVRVEIRNIAGRVVAELAAMGLQTAGSHVRMWNLRGTGGGRVPSGVYLCTITAVSDVGTMSRRVCSLVVER